MRNRRFLLLAAVLVSVNTALWLATGARAVVVATLFGTKMVRADVVENTGAEWRIDRGIVTSNIANVLTVTESDGRVQPIAVTSSTKVNYKNGTTGAIKNVKAGWHVLVTWPAPSGPADAVLVERRS